MNGFLCLGLASAIAAALFGQAAISSAVSAGYAASLPTDVKTPEGRANLRYFGRKYARAPLYLVLTVAAASSAGTFITLALR